MNINPNFQDNPRSVRPPLDIPHHEHSACAAALAMLDSVQELNREREEEAAAVDLGPVIRAFYRSGCTPNVEFVRLAAGLLK
jgi:hypothetical protein